MIMPTLKEWQACMKNSGISPETLEMIVIETQRSFPGEKIYVASGDAPSKKSEIIESLRKLPAGVVAERHGVSRRYVNSLIKRRR